MRVLYKRKSQRHHECGCGNQRIVYLCIIVPPHVSCHSIVYKKVLYLLQKAYIACMSMLFLQELHFQGNGMKNDLAVLKSICELNMISQLTNL